MDREQHEHPRKDASRSINSNFQGEIVAAVAVAVMT